MTQENLLQKSLRFNTIVNLIDGGFFGFALGLASFSTVIPLFIANFTDSATWIGLVPAIHAVGWQFPQLMTARWVSRMRRFKPFVLFMTVQERLPFLGLALLAWWSPAIDNRLTLIIAFSLLVWQGVGGGLTANAWQNFIGKIIPHNLRATFFGAQSAAANLLGGIGAILAGFILERLDFPTNFMVCFLLASGMMVISWVFLSLSREPDHPIAPEGDDQKVFWRKVLVIIRKDQPFRWFIISRILFQFATMAAAFYTVYAVKVLGMGEVAAGVMTSILFIVQVVSNIAFGWLADRKGRLPVLMTGALCAVIAAGAAWLAPDYNWFYPIMVFAGMASSVFWTIGIAVSLEFGTEQERPTYVGLANTLIAPSAILAPLLGGWLADWMSYRLTFLVSALFGLLTWLILFFFVRIPQKAPLTAPIVYSADPPLDSRNQ
ncbi:MAG: MFS transporter [Chloroflexota bacterium]|nr:MAG: MFS transporter [Bellilinea sp.]